MSTPTPTTAWNFDLMWEQLATQLPSLRQALGRIDPDELEEV